MGAVRLGESRRVTDVHRWRGGRPLGLQRRSASRGRSAGADDERTARLVLRLGCRRRMYRLRPLRVLTGLSGR